MRGVAEDVNSFDPPTKGGVSPPLLGKVKTKGSERSAPIFFCGAPAGSIHHRVNIIIEARHGTGCMCFLAAMPHSEVGRISPKKITRGQLGLVVPQATHTATEEAGPSPPPFGKAKTKGL